MKQNQHQQILKYLEEHGKISRFNAMVRLGVSNLPQRIKELKAKGYDISDRKIKHINRNGRKINYKEYFINGGNEQ